MPSTSTKHECSEWKTTSRHFCQSASRGRSSNLPATANVDAPAIQYRFFIRLSHRFTRMNTDQIRVHPGKPVANYTTAITTCRHKSAVRSHKPDNNHAP